MYNICIYFLGEIFERYVNFDFYKTKIAELGRLFCLRDM
nr:MAG TPA: hypothetical protein [Caudoviricetes sp.]